MKNKLFLPNLEVVSLTFRLKDWCKIIIFFFIYCYYLFLGAKYKKKNAMLRTQWVNKALKIVKALLQ